MKRNFLMCHECGVLVSISNFSKHTGSKTCENNKLYGIPEKINVPENLICRYCSLKCKNNNSFLNHERTCSLNSKRQHTHFSAGGVKNFKPSNQYIKAKNNGLSKPIPSALTVEKWKKSYHTNRNFSYSSKECEKFIQNLLVDIPELINFKLYYHGNPHEYVLNFPNGNKVCFDFTIKELKLIIEYNGVRFHPKSIDDKNFKPIFESQGTVKECWERDKKKIDLAKQQGYDVIIYWSDSTEETYKKTVEYIKNILKKCQN